MTCTTFRRVLAVSVLVLPLLFGLSSQVAAQEQTTPEQAAPAQAAPAQTAPDRRHRAGRTRTAAPAQAAPEVGKAKLEQGKLRVAEEVTVTGTMIPRRDLTALSPVAVVDVRGGHLPGDRPCRGPDPAAAAGLRGAELLDLQRRVGHGDGAICATWARSARCPAQRAPDGVRRRVRDTAADLNFIPSALVKRVDILTGGASSVYGADAVAGVVNFVLDTEFQGFRGERPVERLPAQQQQRDRTGRSTRPRASPLRPAAPGTTAATTSTWPSAASSTTARATPPPTSTTGTSPRSRRTQRDYTNCSVGARRQRPGLRRLEHVAVRSFPRPTIRPGLRPGPEDGQPDTFRDRTGADVYNYAPINFMQRNDQQVGRRRLRSTTSSATQVEPYAEVMVMDDYSDAQIAPSGDFGNTTARSTATTRC